eukprot:m.77962 g.77962  ORF g.77962 m.77962 type:complete len:2863 (-) comp8558_c0_seq1:272-8860(-)
MLSAATLLVLATLVGVCSGWVNNYNAYLSYQCPSNSVMYAWQSVHNNYYQDRIFNFYCATVNTITSRTYTGYVNNFNAQIYYVCPSGYSMSYANSYHNNYNQDRRFRFGCARHTDSYGAYQSSCYWTGYTNYFNGYQFYAASSTYTIRGVRSYHNNYYQDRRWSFYSCRLDCRYPFYRSGRSCVCPYSYYYYGYQCVSQRLCGYGQRAARSYSNYACYSCQLGQYQNKYNHLSTSCTSCAPGTYQNQYGQRYCTACPSSTYQPYYGQSYCRSCSTGYYRSTAAAQARCQPGYKCAGSCSRQACSPGTYQNQYGQTTCKTCPYGTYQTQYGQTACVGCSPGYYTVSSSTVRYRCEPGYYCSGCRRYRCSGEYFQGAYGQSSCARARTCGVGQFQSRAPTATTDRVCSTCPSGTFQTSSSHTLTYCYSVRNCAAGTYVSKQPTSSNDRVCTNCASGTYSTTTNSNSCRAVSTCGSGQYAYYVSASSGALCRSCPSGSYQDAPSHVQTSCKRVSAACAVGKYESIAPTSSNDRTCANCPANTFSFSQGVTSCTSHSTCAVGYTQSTAPTSSTDRVCRQCNGVNEYQDQSASTSCKTISTCPSGQYQTRAPTRSTNRLCSSCTSSCPSGSALVGTCSQSSNPTCMSCHSTCSTCSGTSEKDCTTCRGSLKLGTDGRCTNPDCLFDEYRDANDVCQKCHPSCGSCDGPMDSDCASCDGTNYLENDKCVGKCTAGYFRKMQTDNTNHDDNVCAPCTICSSGKYALNSECDGSKNNDVSCKDWSTCPIAQEEGTAPTATSDRKCVSCPNGMEYQDRAGERFCKAVSNCMHGDYISAQPTVSTDRLCSKCSAGTYTNAINAASCIKCPPGSSQNAIASPSCNDCGLGKYQPDQGQTACKDIPPGYYGTGGSPSTRTGIRLCPAGSYCTGGAFDQRPCPPDQYQPEEGQTSCNDVTSCTDGEYVKTDPTSQSDRVCADCPAGTYQDDTEHDEDKCIPFTDCQKGSYISTIGTSKKNQQCTSCTSGTYQDQVNQRSCKAATDCPAGKSELQGPTPSTDRTCTTCTAGVDFTSDSGEKDCKDVLRCQAGTYQTGSPTATSDRICSNCPSGKFSTVENQLMCTEVSLCKAGEREQAVPSASGDRVCVPCDAGHHYPIQGHTADDCRVNTVCEAGEYVVADATLTSDTVCENCKLGYSFSLKDSLTSCTLVQNCTQGERQSMAPSTSTDRVCVGCPSGFYQDAFNHNFPSCKSVSDCGRGSHVNFAPTNSTDRICELCDGTNNFQDRVNQAECKNVTMCASDEYELTPPSDDSDRICAKCKAASSCNSNEYLAGTCGGDSGTENTRCAACHPTCFGCSGSGANECLDCSQNLNFRNHMCLSDCPDGEYSDNGDCKVCHATCYDCDGPMSTDCVQCSGDLFLDDDTDTCVKTCPRNFFAKDNRCVQCSSCPQGTWASTPCSDAADTECTAWTVCQAGEKESVSPTSYRDRECVNCVVGREYQPMDEQRFCILTTLCEEPDIEVIKPTLTTDRGCTCDTQSCTQLINNIYEQEVCAEPTADQLKAALVWCCGGITRDGLIDNIQATDEYSARHTCTGCTDTCMCDVGYVLDYDKDSADCIACDGITEFAPRGGSEKCTQITQCQRGQNEVVKPTFTSDRECSECPAGSIDHDNNGLTSCVECDAGVYAPEASFGSCDTYKCRPGTSDSDSNPATPCVSCVLGTSYQPMSGQTKCLNVTSCAPGEEEVRPMTLISDRVCDECAQGTFKAEFGQGLACQKIQECLPGFEETALPTSTSDRVCTACKEGFFKTDAGHATECIAVTECGPGEEEVRSPTRQHDRQCRSCFLSITYRPPNSETCVPVTRCAASEFISTPATLTTNAKCSAVDQCQAETFQVTEPTYTSDRVCGDCTMCPDGRFETRACSALEDVQCDGCSVCPPHTYIAQNCDAEKDVVCFNCTVCETFEFQANPCTGNKDTNCKTARVCQQDEFQVIPPTATSDRVCWKLTTCKDTEYQQDAPTLTTDRECRKITVCDPGEQTAMPATFNKDATCEPCPTGTSDINGDGSDLCQPCGQGHFVPQGSIGPCKHYECPAGTADSDEEAASECEPCELGVSFSSKPASTSCTTVTECEPGYEETARPTLYTDRQCRRCILGLTFRGDSDQACARVSNCPMNYFQIAEPTISSDRVCQEGKMCGNGTYVSTSITPSSDRVCDDWSLCSGNEYQSVAPTELSDRICSPISICTLSQYENSAPTATSNRICAAISSCQEDFYELVASTPTSDRVCARGYSVDIIFDLPFYSTIGVKEDEMQFTEELIGSINKTLDASLILQITYSEGSIVANVVSLDDGFIADLHNATRSGLISVHETTPGLCHQNQFLNDPDPNPFAPPNCEDLTACQVNQYQSISPTFTSDRVCAGVTLCGREEYVAADYTATTDRICATDAPSLSTTLAASTQALSAGLTVIVSLICIFILVIVLAFAVWRHRKVSKDKRQNEFIERMKNTYNDDISEGNTLLRQLSLRDKSVQLFDNPVFANQGSARPEWFVGPMTRAEVVDHLNARGQIIGDFAVRESSSNGAFVLSVRVEADRFEHYKLAKDDQGNFTIDLKPMQVPCKTLDQLIDHLTRYVDNVTVLLYLEDEYGQMDQNMTLKFQNKANVTAENPDFYGSITMSPQDSYGSILRNARPKWLQGKLTRGEAEVILAADRTPGNFLIRESKAREGTYAISLVIEDGRVEHHALRMENGAFILNEKKMSMECLTLDEVVNHLGYNAESMSRTLAVDESAIPGMEGFSNPNMFPVANTNNSYDTLPKKTTLRKIVQNPGYADLENTDDDDVPPPVNAPKPSYMLVGDESSDDAPPVRPPKPYSSLPPKPDAFA